MNPLQSALLLFCISGLCGCSLIGLGIGALVDGGKPDSETIRVGAAMDLKAGDEIRIALVDSTVVEGVYKESALLDSATYARRYAGFLAGAGAGVAVPLLGDTLFLHTKTGRLPYRYVFRGFGIGSMKLLWLDKSQTTTIALSYPKQLERSDGTMFDPAMLERMRLPTDVLLVVRTATGTARVPVDDIAQIDRPNSTNSKWIGLGMGAAADIIIIVSISDGFKGIRLFDK